MVPIKGEKRGGKKKLFNAGQLQFVFLLAFFFFFFFLIQNEWFVLLPR